MNALKNALQILDSYESNENLDSDNLLHAATYALIVIAEEIKGCKAILAEGFLIRNAATMKIAEQLEKMNDNITDIGIANGWWELEDRLEHAIRKQQEDK